MVKLFLAALESIFFCSFALKNNSSWPNSTVALSSSKPPWPAQPWPYPPMMLPQKCPQSVGYRAALRYGLSRKHISLQKN